MAAHLPPPCSCLQSKCFRHRLAFVDFCSVVQQHFSSKFIKASTVVGRACRGEAAGALRHGVDTLAPPITCKQAMGSCSQANAHAWPS